MAQNTKQLLGQQAREAILKGVNKVYDAVKLTLGPQGGNALMYRTYGRGPRITNDGVTISECIEPQDEFENLSASAFKEASKRTNERVGDGTTTTIVIAGHLINEVFGKLSESSSELVGKGATKKAGVMQLKKEMIAAGEKVEGMIAARANKIMHVEDLIKIATVSVEDPAIGKIIAEIVFETGLEGFVDVVEGYKTEIETETIHGMRFPAKVSAKAFVNNPARFEMVAEDCPVLITNYALDNAVQLAKFTKRLTSPKLVIFAPSFAENVLVAMVAAAKQGVFFYPVKTPALRTEQYEDLAAYCDAAFVNKDKGRKLENVQESELGFLEKIIVKDTDAREDAVVTGGRGAKSGVVAERIEILKKQKEETKEEIHKKLVDRRIASMASAIGVIKVGAPSQAEGLYLLKKIEDAVYACKAALEEGYVDGGGLCLKEIADEIAVEEPDNILLNALRAPYEQIQANAEGELLIPDEIIDPAKVVRLAVGHAVSVVAHLATVKIMVPEIRDRTPAEGYNDIAKAINRYVLLWGRQQSLITENEKAIAWDNEEIFRDNLLKDLG